MSDHDADGADLAERSRRRAALANMVAERKARSRRALVYFSGSAASMAVAIIAGLAWYEPAPRSRSETMALRSAMPPDLAAPTFSAPAAKDTAGPAAPARPATPAAGPPEPPKPAAAVSAEPIAAPPPKAPARPAPPVPQPIASKPAAGPIIQIGAFPSRGEADKALAAAAGRVGALGGQSRHIESVSVRGATLYRGQFTGFASASDARAACAAVRQTGGECFVK